MNKKYQMLFLTIFVGMLTLAACGSEGDEAPDGRVFYEPEFIPVTSKMEMLDDWCSSREDGYMLCRKQNQGNSPRVVQRI